ncbi:hypothetical protein VTI74DRAFT_6182 [Chaetomium olivicolor]
MWDSVIWSAARRWPGADKLLSVSQALPKRPRRAGRSRLRFWTARDGRSGEAAGTVHSKLSSRYRRECWPGTGVSAWLRRAGIGVVSPELQSPAGPWHWRLWEVTVHRAHGEIQGLRGCGEVAFGCVSPSPAGMMTAAPSSGDDPGRDPAGG